MTAQDSGDPGNYRKIVLLLFTSFAANAAMLFLLNLNSVETWLREQLGAAAGFVQLFFWGAVGATIACSIFVANDKEVNELEALKEDPDPDVLRYPDSVDVMLYGQRIVSSGFLGVFAAVMLLTGLKYFDAPTELAGQKQELFFVVLAMLIGLYEGRFLTSLNNLSKRVFKTG